MVMVHILPFVLEAFGPGQKLEVVYPYPYLWTSIDPFLFQERRRDNMGCVSGLDMSRH